MVKSNWQRFFYGAVGAAAPEVVRLYKTLDLASVHFSWVFFLLAVAFVAIGGAFAIAWEDDHAIKCIYIGSTFPVWLSAWAHIIAASSYPASAP